MVGKRKSNKNYKKKSTKKNYKAKRPRESNNPKIKFRKYGRLSSAKPRRGDQRGKEYIDPKRITALLKVLGSVWKEHHQLRLGQLLSILCVDTNQPLQEVSDKDLLERLEKYKDRIVVVCD